MKITDKASAKIKEIAEAEGIGHTSVRVSIKGGGCAGYTFDMVYDDKPGDLDEVEEIDGVKVIIDPMSFQYMEDVIMDYVSSALGEGFKFMGGAIKSTCGCGSSVSF